MIRPSRLVRLWIVAVIASAAWAPPVRAQNRLVQARARIDATDAARTRVEIDYRIALDGTAAGAPFEGLAFRPAEVSGASAWVGSAPALLTLTVADNGRMTGTVELPAALGGEHRVRVAYDVRAAWDGTDPRRLRVPLLALSWPSEQALPGVFEAEALLPGDLTVFESFPSGFAAAGTVGGMARYTLDLPASPALLSLRASTSTVRFGGLVRILDGLVVLTLVAMAVGGWHHFTRTPPGERV